MSVEFEFDELKSEANRAKHGIDFVSAQDLWRDERLIVAPARTTDEPRFVVVGVLGEIHWSAVITYRGASVRLISVRRSRPEEIAIYESE